MVPVTIIGIGVITFLVTFVTLRKFQAGLSDRAHPDEGLNRVLSKQGADPSQQVQALIREGENESLELKSSVRWNFKAGRTGKEMELAWLKTVVAYLNTEGGVILLGVDDAGEVLGLDKDGFTNDDKALRHIENLIARHIGPAYFPYIRSRMISVEGKKVLIIDCGTSPKPVFLKHDKGEDFYIRTGPASRSLAPSEILAYIETRKLQ
jgi:predicted HTH transcriptional regulator